jgi:phospholipid/cholesterol/gamma-HCH transport system ATP-binding protein
MLISRPPIVAPIAASIPAADFEPIVEVRDLHMRFGDVWVHRGVDLVVARGDMLALVGGSGSGKTTLLRQMVGLLQPTRGEIRLFGESLAHDDIERDRALRRRFGMLFQQGALFSSFTVFDNIAFPLRELRCFDKALIHDLVMLKLAMVELLPRHAWLMPAELSGGMVTRVALARALALEPELLFLDEPTAGLDPDRSDAFVRLIRMLGKDLGLTVVLVTHDLDTMAGLASRVAVLADHRILACAEIDQIMQIDHPFIESFFHSVRGQRALGSRRV